MGTVVRERSDKLLPDITRSPVVAAPDGELVRTEVGEILPFAATMELLASFDIPTAPYIVINADESVAVPFAGPYVVKLADVGHRSEHGAVRLAVRPGVLEAAVNEMRELASRSSLPQAVAIQPMIQGDGEVFIGIRSGTELGPVVAFGLGGVFVEVLGRVSGRLAPMTDADAREMIDEFDDLKAFGGYRGQTAWSRDDLARILVAAGSLGAAGRDWIGTFDINPLVHSPSGFAAVDGLCVVRH